MKKDKFSILLLVLAALIITASLASCNKDKEGETGTTADSYVERTECTVTFDSNGGSEISPVTVYKNSSLAPVDTPKRDDYVFVGWTYEGRDWSFGEQGDAVKTDMTLYANWVKLNSVFKYEEIGGEIVITKLINADDYSSFTLPERFNGMAVTGIGDEVFKSISINLDDTLFKGLKSVTFPETVTDIGFAAFQDCYNLEINFKGEITSLGENAFYNCNTIKSIKLGEGLEKIPFRAFSKCQLESVIIPDSVKVIDENSFELSMFIQTAVIPVGTRIEDSAFRDCVLLKTIFFKGNEAQFEEMTVNGNNDSFNLAKVYYHAESNAASNDLWQYDSKGAPTIIG